jgi:hypothetical protein
MTCGAENSPNKAGAHPNLLKGRLHKKYHPNFQKFMYTKLSNVVQQCGTNF